MTINIDQLYIVEDPSWPRFCRNQYRSFVFLQDNFVNLGGSQLVIILPQSKLIPFQSIMVLWIWLNNHLAGGNGAERELVTFWTTRAPRDMGTLRHMDKFFLQVI